MQARLDPRKAAPDAMKAISDLHVHVRESRLDHKLLELISIAVHGAWTCTAKSCAPSGKPAHLSPRLSVPKTQIRGTGDGAHQGAHAR
jgi:hypothetical protein